MVSFGSEVGVVPNHVTGPTGKNDAGVSSGVDEADHPLNSESVRGGVVTILSSPQSMCATPSGESSTASDRKSMPEKRVKMSVRVSDGSDGEETDSTTLTAAQGPVKKMGSLVNKDHEEKMLETIRRKSVKVKQLTRGEELKMYREKQDHVRLIFDTEADPTPYTVRFNSSTAMAFAIALLISAVWSVFFTPLYCAFSSVWDFDTSTLVLDFIVDFVYMAGIVVTFRTTVCDPAVGKEWTSPGKIRHWILGQRSFYTDVLSFIPLIFPVVSIDRYDARVALQVLKLLRVLRVFSIPTCFAQVQFVTSVHIARIAVFIFMLSHWISCIWFIILWNGGTILDHFKAQGLREIDLTTYYLFALRDGTFLLLARDREAFMNAELLFLGMVGPCSGIFFAMICAHLTALYGRIDAVRRRQNEQLCFVRSAMESLQLPHRLRKRIEQYHHFLAVAHNLSAYSYLFQGLSSNLFTEVKANIYERLFKQAAFFSDAPDEFINAMALIMEEVTFSPGDTVVRQGDIGNEMYFILRGKCEVMGNQLEVVHTLRENSYFGEIALLVQMPRLATVRASTYVLLSLITRDRFIPIIDEFPEQRKKITSRVQGYTLAKDLDDEDEDSSSEDEDGQCSDSTPTKSSSPVATSPCGSSRHENLLFVSTQESTTDQNSMETEGSSKIRTQVGPQGLPGIVPVSSGHELNGAEDFSVEGKSFGADTGEGSLRLRRKRMSDRSERSSLTNSFLAKKRTSRDNSIFSEDTETGSSTLCRVRPYKRVSVANEVPCNTQMVAFSGVQEAGAGDNQSGGSRGHLHNSEEFAAGRARARSLLAPNTGAASTLNVPGGVPGSRRASRINRGFSPHPINEDAPTSGPELDQLEKAAMKLQQQIKATYVGAISRHREEKEESSAAKMGKKRVSEKRKDDKRERLAMKNRKGSKAAESLGHALSRMGPSAFTQLDSSGRNIVEACKQIVREEILETNDEVVEMQEEILDHRDQLEEIDGWIDEMDDCLSHAMHNLSQLLANSQAMNSTSGRSLPVEKHATS